MKTALKNKLLFEDRLIAALIFIVEKEDKTVWEKAVYGLLVFLSRIYGFVIRCRLRLFKWGLLKNRTLGCLVISVGNITTGGTGKTPIVEVFARALSEEGRKVAVLTRGYRRKTGKKEVLVVQGDKLPDTSYDVGDEAFLLARNLKNIPVIVGKDRLKTGEYAINKLGADTLILDDGYQYLSLLKKVNIVCVDANNPFGNGNLIPAGFLREPLEGLSRANLFFLTKVRKDSNGEVDAISEKLRKYNKDASIVETTYVPKCFVNLVSGNISELDFVKGRGVFSIAAIADPGGFEDLLKDIGADLKETNRFPDHHFFTKEELEEVDKACGASKSNIIVMTEKDFVKLPPGFRFHSRAYYLKVEMNILRGADNFTDCISKLCFT